MSIFGIKRKHNDTSVLRQEISNMRGKVLQQINELNSRHTGLQGRYIELRNTNTELQNTNTELQNTYTELQNTYTGLQSTVREININHRLLYSKVEKITDKQIISIFAESKGSLENDEVLSFGNGGKKGAGYVMNFPGQILGIGLSSNRLGGDVTVVVSINGNHQTGYDITLDGNKSRERPLGVEEENIWDFDFQNIILRKHNNFDKPLRVEAGDTIDFICKGDNVACYNTVASMIIELFI